MYTKNRSLAIDGNPTKYADMDVEDRCAAKMMKPFYQIESCNPGSEVRYTTQTQASKDSSVDELKIYIRFDFPLGAQLDKEEAELQAMCEQKF